jgi:hypothetical protein
MTLLEARYQDSQQQLQAALQSITESGSTGISEAPVAPASQRRRQRWVQPQRSLSEGNSVSTNQGQPISMQAPTAVPAVPAGTARLSSSCLPQMCAEIGNLRELVDLRELVSQLQVQCAELLAEVVGVEQLKKDCALAKREMKKANEKGELTNLLLK